jgi:DNA polymerase elongation subunit (family B)
MKPKILIFDVETAPILGYVWNLFDQNIALNQIKSDWHLLSWSAKWLGEKKVMYMDQRGAKDVSDDRKILAKLWELLDEADVVLTQNGKKFDVRKVNARFILQGFRPPSPYRHIDTLQLAKKHFGFTSNKLAYMSEKLCTKFKKSEHKKFPGFELWKACLAGNIQAWKEMEHYNKQDVLSLEELYLKLAPWGTGGVDLSVHDDLQAPICNCGSIRLQSRGYAFSSVGKFKKYQCQECGAWMQSKHNLLPKNKRKTLYKKSS